MEQYSAPYLYKNPHYKCKEVLSYNGSPYTPKYVFVLNGFWMYKFQFCYPMSSREKYHFFISHYSNSKLKANEYKVLIKQK